jgi:hypothetical protein
LAHSIVPSQEKRLGPVIRHVGDTPDPGLTATFGWEITMKKYMTLVGAAALAMTLAGCMTVTDVQDSNSDRIHGSGELRTESRAVSDFSAISLSGAGRLVIEQTGEETLTITAEHNILPYLTSEVHHGRLTLGTRPNTNLSPSREIEYRLTVRDLSEIEVSGGAAVEATGIDTPFFAVAISGAASVYLEGWAERQDVAISGAASYQARNLESREVTISVSGVAVAVVNASDYLEAHVSGAGVHR